MNISIIAAIGTNRELGKDNKLLWNIPEDMNFFREKTKGKTIIMGRKTFESIGRVLPKRNNIIITRNKNYVVKGAIVTHCLEDALEKAKELERNEIFIIGGAEIYKQSIKFADTLYLTIVHKSFDADSFFPDYEAFSKVVSKRNSQDENFEYTFYERLK